MEEGVLDVELLHEPTLREHQSEHGADAGMLHHRTKSLIEVHARVLGEPPKHPTCLVPVKRTVSLKLVLKDPHAGDDVGPWRLWYQVPCPIGQEGLVFLFHGVPQVGVSERATDRGRGGRQCWGGRGGELQFVHGLGDPGSAMSDHWVCSVGVTSDGDKVVDRWLGL
jgi:hypothetical protein